ncbi:hypothetical protein HZA26_03845 [Candidatus Nomurabacteria bacterium]|nr:hypothetical protein [Candidatus Nomurabacteria bacterium]
MSHDTTATTPSTAEAGKGRSIVVGVLLILMFALIVIRVKYFRSDDGQQESSTVPTSAPAQAREEVRLPGPCEGPATPRTFDVPDEGLVVYLCQGMESFPTGAVTMTNAEGRLYHDSPEKPARLGYQKNGVWIIRPDPIGSNRKIRIFNRW